MLGYPSRRMTRTSLALALVVLVAVTGCGASATPSPAAPSSAGAPAPLPTQEVPETVVSPYSDDELAQQFEHGRELLLAGKIQEAAAVFDKLVRLAPDGQIAPPSLYNAGMCHEDLGDRDAAIDRYAALTTRFPTHASARPALLRPG